MRKKEAIVMLQEILIPRGSEFRVQQDFRRKDPEYECYIAAGSDIDLVADTDGDQVPSNEYNTGRAHITVVTFLHKGVFRPKALVVNWHKPREKKSAGTPGPLRESVLAILTSIKQQRDGWTFKNA